jgi:NADH-quinone oxidoreductase subunit G
MTITINGKQFEFNNGETILQVALRNGIAIPHFCYHPAMSIAGNCRICLVEVEKMPKLVIACGTAAADGMIVHTKSEKSINAQNAVMEFLLINHPLDCPICDEAGECKLQEYAYKYGTGISRFDEEKNKKKKRVELGPNVMLDQDRCIACSRCIRYCDEVAKAPQLTFVKRGEKVAIEAFPGMQLDNPYSMNVIEICPVGALTSRDFRFKSRVWEMSFTESICLGCSRGCNIKIGVRNNQILRLNPRENPDVNEYWMCDHGRLDTFKFINDKELRISTPKIKLDEPYKTEEKQISVGWDEAVSKTASLLTSHHGKIFFLASPYKTIEDNYALKKFANDVCHIDDIYYLPHINEKFGDDILRKSDMTPNTAGLKFLGFKQAGEDFIRTIKKEKNYLLFTLNDPVNFIIDEDEFTSVFPVSIQLFSLINKFTHLADVLYPISTYAEVNGTFMNFRNRIQRLRPAVTTLEEERLLGEHALSRWDKFGAPNDRWTHGYKFNARPTWMIIKQIAQAMGKHFEFENSEEVFMEFCNSYPELKGLDYDAVGSQGLQLKTL